MRCVFVKIKRAIIFTLVLVFSMCCSLTGCAAQDTNGYDSINTTVSNVDVLLQIDNPSMMVNGSFEEIDPGNNTSPIVQNGRTLVPIRAIIEAFGGTVGWDNDTQTVTLNYKEDTIKLTIDSTLAYKNNESEILDVAPQIINGRTMLPIRFVAEGFKFDVLWIAENSCIAITNHQAANSLKVPEKWSKQENVTPKEETSGTSAVTEGALKVHFIDVGQGDSIFIELPNDETLLIDAGPSSGIVNKYLSSLGHTKINYIVATHPDADHINGMPEVLNSFSVDKFYMPEKEHTTKIFDSMLDAIENNGCDAIYAKAGNAIVEGTNLSVKFVSPTKNYGDNNNASAVVKLQFGNNSFLFMGDAEISVEHDIINAGYDISADVLKVGHHGSDSSTSDYFIKKVKPKYAVISAGKNNRYGHPTSGVLAILQNNNIDVYRTDEVGTIVFTCDGVSYSIDKIKSSIQINAPPATNTNTSIGNSEEDKTVQSNVNNNSSVVYRTKTGSKYHVLGCSYLKSQIETTVSEAKSMGLTPCSRCNPPQ